MALHNKIHRITDTDEHARDYLFQRGILKALLWADDSILPKGRTKSLIIITIFQLIGAS